MEPVQIKETWRRRGLAAKGVLTLRHNGNIMTISWPWYDYTTLCICQNLSNYTLKIGELCRIHLVVLYSLSHFRLFATPWTVAQQAPSSMRVPGQEHWSGLPFPSPVYTLYLSNNADWKNETNRYMLEVDLNEMLDKISDKLLERVTNIWKTGWEFKDILIGKSQLQ